MSERPDQPDRWLRFANLRALAASLPVPALDLDADDLDALNPWITADPE